MIGHAIDLDTPVLFRGREIDPATGHIRSHAGHGDALFRAVTIEPLPVFPGTVLHWKRKEAAYRVYFYTTETDETWVYTFAYEMESNWASYDPDRSDQAWSHQDRIFAEEGFIRLEVQSAGVAFSPEKESEKEEMKADRFFVLQHTEEARQKRQEIAPFFRQEIEAVSRRLEAVREPGDTVWFLVTDPHFAINGTWDDTAKNMKAMAKRCCPGAVIQLGDLTDGILPRTVTKQYSGRILRDLREVSEEVYGCLGNHDSNYTACNPEQFSRKEAVAWYLPQSGNRPDGTGAEGDREYYYIDLPGKNLRLFFLSSFDCEQPTEEERYVYSDEECAWLQKTLEETPEGCDILVFSHVPLLPAMHVWSRDIRGSERVLQILESWQHRHKEKILAYIHGHSHSDQIEKAYGFPIVAVGCSKLESFPDMKPPGAVCYERKRHTVTQDLWDIVQISRDHRFVRLFRFGAGEDRVLHTGKQG